MKNSIKTLIAIVAISLQINSLYAQSRVANTGVYLTEQDYKAGKLSYVLSAGDKMHLNSFLNGKSINISYQGKKIKLLKSEIFGYHQNNLDYRFYKNEAYQVLDTAGFLLYSKDQLTQVGKGPKPELKYFYSVSTQKPVLSLTLDNIYKSFPTETGFRYHVENSFQQDNDLTRFDKTNKQYEIKYLYQAYRHNPSQQHASL